MTGGEHGPILHPVRTDPIESLGEFHQRLASVSRDVPSRSLVAVHGDGAAGEEKVDHPQRNSVKR